jgi:hypothetical protein
MTRAADRIARCAGQGLAGLARRDTIAGKAGGDRRPRAIREIPDESNIECQ